MSTERLSDAQVYALKVLAVYDKYAASVTTQTGDSLVRRGLAERAAYRVYNLTPAGHQALNEIKEKP